MSVVEDIRGDKRVRVLVGVFRRGSGSVGVSGLKGFVESGSSHIVHTVDKLESSGLVERRSHDFDGRRKVLVLTERGRRVAEVLDELLRLFDKVF